MPSVTRSTRELQNFTPEQLLSHFNEVRVYHFLFDGIKLRHRPIVKSILLNFVLFYTHKIDWINLTFEIKIDGHILPDTNIIHIFTYLLTNKSDEHQIDPRPRGHEIFYSRLIEIGVPDTCILNNFFKFRYRRAFARAAMEDHDHITTERWERLEHITFNGNGSQWTN